MQWGDNSDLIAQLILAEGRRQRLYRCPSGKLTIGIGRNIEDVGLRPGEDLLLLKGDIEAVCDGLDRHLPWWRELGEPRQRVLIDLAFNMGIGALLQFRRTLEAIQRGDWAAAAIGLRSSLYARQVGARAEANARTLECGVWVPKTEVA